MRSTICLSVTSWKVRVFGSRCRRWPRQREGAARGGAAGVVDVVGLGDGPPLGGVAVLGGGEAAERVAAPQQARLDVVAGLGGRGADLDGDVDVFLQRDAEGGAGRG